MGIFSISQGYLVMKIRTFFSQKRKKLGSVCNVAIYHGRLGIAKPFWM